MSPAVSSPPHPVQLPLPLSHILTDELIPYVKFCRSKEEVKEIASKGGKASGGTGNSANDDDDSSSGGGSGKQGFASMDPDKQVSDNLHSIT